MLPPVYLYDTHAGPQRATSFGALYHRERHPVLVRPGWIEVFELDEDIGRTARNEALQMHDRRAADCLKHRINGCGQ